MLNQHIFSEIYMIINKSADHLLGSDPYRESSHLIQL